MRWARAAGTAGGTAPAVFNAADEACVGAFLAGELPFVGIVDTVARVLDEHLQGAGTEGGARWIDGNATGLSDVLSADVWARRRASELIRDGFDVTRTGG